MGHPNPARRSPRGFQISDVCNLYFPRPLRAFIVTVPTPLSVRDFNMRPSSTFSVLSNSLGGARDTVMSKQPGRRGTDSEQEHRSIRSMVSGSDPGSGKQGGPTGK